MSGGAFGVVWGLVRGNQSGWGSPEVVTSLVAGVVLLGAFVRWQLQTPTPMLPPRLFRSRAFTAGNAAIFLPSPRCSPACSSSPSCCRSCSGHDALGAGLRLLPWTATFITVAPVAGALADRIGERLLLSVGLALQAAGFLWLVAVADPGLTYGQLVGPFVLAGVGVSMAIPCAQNAVVGGVDSESIGAAAGVNSMMRELGGVFGIAVTVAVFAGNGDYGSVLGFLDGFRPAIVTAAGFALVGAVCGVAVPARQRPRHGPARPGARVMSRVMVRYQVHPDRVGENIALVQAVYAELATLQPPGFRYTTYQCDDGVTFVHLAISDGPAPLPGLAAFQRFRTGLPERCAQPPVCAELSEVGSFGGPQA